MFFQELSCMLMLQQMFLEMCMCTCEWIRYEKRLKFWEDLDKMEKMWWPCYISTSHLASISVLVGTHELEDVIL